MRKIFTLCFLLALVCVKGWGQTTKTFSYTGSDQIFTVPAGVTSISVKVWGAGGGSGYFSSGGSGAFVKGTLAVTPGQTLIIAVGGAGKFSSSSNTYGGGGASGATGYGASGGGLSGIFKNSSTQTNALVIAGGGGGGAGGPNSITYYGGGGGATTGTAGGGYNTTTYTGGSGGSISAGGTGGLWNGSSAQDRSGQNGTALFGGNSVYTTFYTYDAGGGGGGYYGGGSGYVSSSGTMTSSGGGGGASYISSFISGTTNSVGSTSANGTTAYAPGGNETGYSTGIGNGADNGSNYGGYGLVYFSYTAVTCSAVSIPYTQNFDGVTVPALPSCWSISDVDGDGNTWQTANSLSTYPPPSGGSSPNALFCRYDASAANNDWAFSSPITLTAGNTYVLTFKYAAYSSGYTEKLEVKYGTTATVAGMTTTAFTNPGFSTTAYTATSVNITPTTTGTYYLGFHDYSVTNQYGIFIDDISVTSLPGCTTPSIPASVTLGISTVSTQAGTIGAPTVVPTGYMVVSSTSSTAPTPVNGTPYTAGQTLGSGTVQYVGASTAFTASSLASNTNYYYFVYSYNSGCTGAPYYSTSVSASKYTCIAAPTALAAGSISGSSASISWTGSSGTITSYSLKYGISSGTYTTTVPNVTSPDLLTGLNPTTTYYYVIVANNTNNTNSGCGTSNQSAQASFTTTCNPIGITTQPTGQTVCEGSGFTLSVTGSNANAYQWQLGGVSISGATGTSYTVSKANALNAGFYTVILSNTCGTQDTSNITRVVVNPVPTAVTVSPATAAVCAGNIQQLTASGGAIASDTLLLETFNGNAPGWLQNNLSTGGIPANATWILPLDGYMYTNSNGTTTTFHSNDNSQFALSNSDAQGSGSNTLTDLYAPVINATGLTSLSLNFYQYFRYNSSADSATVQVSTDNTNWTTLTKYTATIGTAAAFNNTTLDLSAYINKPAVYIRFHYTSAYGYYWAIDNVKITGAGSFVTWAPTTPTNTLYTDAGATTAYTAGTYLTTVYAKPTANTTYTATAANGTCAVNGTSAITVNPLPTASVVINPTAICSGNTAQVTINGTANAAVNYDITYNGITKPHKDTLNSSGTYVFTTPSLPAPSTQLVYAVKINTVTATAATGGCVNSTTSTYNLTVNPLPTASISGTTAVCQNAAQPGITFTGAGGTAPYIITYNINGGTNKTATTSGNSVTVSQATTTPGTYAYNLVSVQDGSSTHCPNTASGNATVTVNPLPTATIVGTTTVCQNSPSPNITFTGAGGTAPYTFTYTINGGGQTTITSASTNSSVTLPVSTSTVTTYTYSLVSVKDGSTTTCSNNASGSATVTINPPPSAPTVTPTQPTCATATGAITVTAPTGTGYTYSIDGTTYQPSTTFSGLTANTTYTVYVKNSNGCIATSSATINSQPPSPSAPVTTVTQPTCATATGTITVTAPTGTGYTYSINGSTYQSSTTFSGIATGSYTVYVKNSSNCIATSSATINSQPPSPSIANKTTTASCGGAFSVTPTNGTDVVPGGTTYSWSAPGGTGFTGGAAGNNQSSVSGTLTNTTNAAVTAIYTVTPTAGAPGNCVGNSFTVTVTVNPVPSIANKATTICSANSFNITPTNGTDIVPGGTTYTWSAPTVTTGITGGAAGSGSSITGTLTNTAATVGTATYTVTPTASSCSGASFTVTVTVNSSTVITGNPTGASYCQNATATALSVTATGTGTLTYQWYSNTANNTTSGSIISGQTSSSYTPSTATTGTLYYYVIVNSSSCGSATSSTAGIIVNALPTATISGTTTVCQNGASQSITFTGAGGVAPYTFTYNINGGSNQTITTASGNFVTLSQATTTPGTYTYNLVSVQDNSSTHCGNAASGSATVTVNPNATISLTSAAGTDHQTPCINTAITNITYTIGGGGTSAGVTGLPTGVTGAYNNNVFTISGTPTVTGTFNYTVTTTGTCAQTSASGTITVKPNATIVLASGSGAASQSPCAGTAINTITYTIGGGGTGATVSNLPAGLTSTASGTTVTISGTPTASGTYTVTTTGTCAQTTATGTITITALPTAYISNYNRYICTGGTAQVQVTGTIGDKITYTFNGGGNQQTTLTNDGAGHGVFNYTTNALTAAGPSYSTYTFTLLSVTSGSGGCSATLNDVATIQVYPYPAAPAAITGNIYIAKSSSTTLSDATTSGKWTSNNSSIASVDEASGVVMGVSPGTATITYTVTNAGGCSSSASTPVYVYDPNAADYITQSDGNFSDHNNWKVNGGNNTYIPATQAPTSTNSTIIKNKITLDVSYTIGAGKSFTIDPDISLTPSFTIAPGIVFTVNGTADFNGKPVVLRSDASGTAQIGGTVTISNATKVTVERYIPLTATAGGRTGRAWRLLTSPITDATINGAWQEGLVSPTANPPVIGMAGYGTNITGTKQGDAATAASHGFDFWSNIAYTYTSIHNYQGAPTSGIWADMASINGMKISDQPAYLLFVRGDRSKLSPPDAGTTTLRATGFLHQLPTTYTVYAPASQGYSLIGNPYAAVLDFDKILSDNINLIQPQYWRWDAANGTYGGYTLVYKSGNGYTTVPYPLTSGPGTESTTAQYIASGQGFFVQPLATNTSSGMLSITPAHKATAGAAVSPFGLLPPAAAPARLFVNLNLYSALDSSSALADGVMAAFDDAVSSSSGDVAKPYNLNENLGLDKDSGILTVLAHPALVTIADTLHLRLWNTTPRSYQIQVKAENWQAAGLQAYLLDNYLHTTTPLSLSGDVSTVTFTVSSDAASAVQHRFSIVFSPTVLPVTITKVTATKKSDGSVNIDWQVAGETGIKEYTVERSSNGHDFTAIGSVAAGAPSGSYSLTDRSPGSADNYYRIRILSAGGAVSYSVIVKLSFSAAGGKTLITLFPNPVQEGATAYLKVENLAAGVYHAALYTASGQRVQVSVIAHSGGSAVIGYPLPHILAQGTYTLRLFSSDDKQITALPVVVVKK